MTSFAVSPMATIRVASAFLTPSNVSLGKATPLLSFVRSPAS